MSSSRSARDPDRCRPTSIHQQRLRDRCSPTSISSAAASNRCAVHRADVECPHLDLRVIQIDAGPHRFISSGFVIDVASHRFRQPRLKIDVALIELTWDVLILICARLSSMQPRSIHQQRLRDRCSPTSISSAAASRSRRRSWISRRMSSPKSVRDARSMQIVLISRGERPRNHHHAMGSSHSMCFARRNRQYPPLIYAALGTTATDARARRLKVKSIAVRIDSSGKSLMRYLLCCIFVRVRLRVLLRA